MIGGRSIEILQGCLLRRSEAFVSEGKAWIENGSVPDKKEILSVFEIQIDCKTFYPKMVDRGLNANGDKSKMKTCVCGLVSCLNKEKGQRE